MPMLTRGGMEILPMDQITNLADQMFDVAGKLHRYVVDGVEEADLDDLMKEAWRLSTMIYRADGDDEERTLSWILVGAGMRASDQAKERLIREGRWPLVPRLLRGRPGWR